MPLDLDSLDDAALEAATSKGLVRRARRDLEAGTARVIRNEADEAQVMLGDVCVTLRAGGLAAAGCTCPAGDLCRHILSAIILLREASPAPSPSGDVPGAVPSPGEHKAGGTRGAAAPAGRKRKTRAQAPAREQSPAAAQETAGDVLPRALLDQAARLLREWARAGLATAPQPLEERLMDGALEARAAGLHRLGSVLKGLAGDVRRRRERDSNLEPAASLQAAARGYALIEALRRTPEDAGLRGRARDTFDPLGDLTLIGCGYEIWRTPTQARGVTGHFYAPESRAWYSASLARAGGQDPAFVPTQAVQRDSVWGTTLERLCVSEVTLRQAAAAPGGRLSLGIQSKARAQPVTLRKDEIRAWEGAFEDWALLEDSVRARFAPSLRRTQRGAEVAVLLPARIGRPAFDEIAQELVLPLTDRAGRQLAVRVANQPHLEQRLMALQEILAAKSPEAFLVTLAMAGDRLHISPYALLIDSDSTLWSLDAHRPPEKQKGLRGLTDWLTRELAQLTTDLTRPAAGSATASTRLLTAGLDALLGLCELGGQMQDPGLSGRVGALAQRLEAAGLHPAALLLAAVAAAEPRRRPHALLVAAHAVNGMLELVRLPLG